MMKLPQQVKIVEVGPRDGLQNEKMQLSTKEKVDMIKSLAEAGLKNIETTSFTHPKWIPQLADAEEVILQVRHIQGLNISALVPNERGYLRAKAAGVHEVFLVVSASQSHNRANLNRSREETMKDFSHLIRDAHQVGIRVRLGIATAFGCPFEGRVEPRVVVDIAQYARDMNCDELVLADTIGVANPKQVYQLIKKVQQEVPGLGLAVHFHDTLGMGLANALSAMEAGVSTLDSSVGGLGGCPYAPGATGNIATEDLVNMVNNMDIDTGVDIGILVSLAQNLECKLGRPIDSRITRSYLCSPEKIDKTP